MKVGDDVRLAPFWHDTGHVLNFWTWVRVLAVSPCGQEVKVEYLNGKHLAGRVVWLGFDRLELSTIQKGRR